MSIRDLYISNCRICAKCWMLLFAAAMILLFPALSSAMPPGHFLELFPENEKKSRFFFSMQADSQTNDFEKQRERKPEVDSQGEERHYSEIRQSEVTFSQAGIKAGAAINDLPLLYVTAGYGLADIDFHFTDELTGQKNSYTKNISFESDSFPVLGGGIAFRFLRKPVFENSILEAGMDLQYRWLDFEADEGEITYESTLHEIQLSLAAGLDMVEWNLFSRIPVSFSPYGGAKIAHFTGDETYADAANKDAEGDPDPISYNEDLDPGNHVSFFAGASFPFTQNLLMTIETRFGDDDGYAASIIARF